MNLQFPNILRLVREKNVNLFLGNIKLITTRAGSVMLVSKEYQQGYYGRFVDNTGTFSTGRDWSRSSDIHAVMQTIEENGLSAVASIGKALGSCCICGRTLSDPISVKHGIGPICAGKVGFMYPEDDDESEVESLELDPQWRETSMGTHCKPANFTYDDTNVLEQDWVQEIALAEQD